MWKYRVVATNTHPQGMNFEGKWRETESEAYWDFVKHGYLAGRVRREVLFELGKLSAERSKFEYAGYEVRREMERIGK